ncbi:MAG: citrate synthase [Planctomycetota bacterium]
MDSRTDPRLDPGTKATKDAMASLDLGELKVELPIIVGTEGERGLDTSALRAKSGYVTLDPAYMNTASTTSAITFIDGETGILRYRGYPIEELAEHASFVEVCYLLIYGELPNTTQMAEFEHRLERHSLIHEDMRHFFDGYPSTAHPMAVVASMVTSLSTFYPDAIDPNHDEQPDLTVCRLLSKLRTLAAYVYKRSIGQPIVYPRNSISYVGNILHMMFAVPAEPYEVDPVMERALNLLLILHADHEQNCSTSTVRLVGSADTNLFASVSAGICALWGSRHGGANQEVLEMLSAIHADGGDVDKAVRLAKDKNSNFRLFGFGHRVYKNFDPRAKIIKRACDELLTHLGRRDPLLDVARRLEEAALRDEYFIQRKLYPNVDFYSGIMYRAMGIPTDMFTVMFALGRLPGWISHWLEMRADPKNKIGRPRQIYTGATLRHYPVKRG